MFINATYRGTKVRIGCPDAETGAAIMLNDFIFALEGCFESLPITQRRKLVENAQKAQIDLLQEQLTSGGAQSRVVIADDAQGWTTIEITLSAKEALQTLSNFQGVFDGDDPQMVEVAERISSFAAWLLQVTNAYETFGKTIAAASQEANQRGGKVSRDESEKKPKMGPQDVAARVKEARKSVAEESKAKH
ncbi:MAG: hypothetical protein AAF530_17560 [Pseudomonadota bacterium]